MDANDQSTKLLIGRQTSNLLVMSSILLNNGQKNIQVGPSTKGFIVKDPRIYLDSESVAASKHLFDESDKC